jgi:phosphoribosylformimino-5-aminoimidazole carboxamide ribotide isomerase
MRAIPAIDLRDGRVVRLRQGDYLAETRYPQAPSALAAAYAEAGARHLHVVDLDAARDGSASQRQLLAGIVAVPGLSVQAGGGVRRADDVQALLDLGVARVVIGSVAVRAPEQVLAWADRFGAERLLIALDARRDADAVWRLPVAGWTEASTVALPSRLALFLSAGLRDFLVTDIDRDGMLSGPNLDLYATLAAQFPLARVQASGGVASVADVRALAVQKCAAVIIGRALLEGRFSLPEVLTC